AGDGIRDRTVTGVQTCALPIYARLRQHKLWFPVDVSTGDRATIGGMTANNSCGSRSIRYGNMVHNVRAVDAILADGTGAHFGERSEERRVGKEGRCGGWAQQWR